VDLESLGAEMAARKMELMALAEAGTLGRAQPATMQHEGA
jgi:hypothetical protein